VIPEVGVELVNPVAGTRLLLLATASSTAGAYVELEATYPPRSAAPPTHLHPRQDERFTVRAGRLTAVVADVQHELSAGDVLDVPAGVPHQLWSSADDPAVFTWRTEPALRTDAFQCDLWQAAADNGFEPDLMAAFAVTQRYPDEFCLC
jgi:mannose-6-phosphate isomerase-like protein (cupin superfamily)